MSNRTMESPGRHEDDHRGPSKHHKGKPDHHEQHHGRPDGHGHSVDVLTNPDTVVDDLTIRQWSQEWLKTLIATSSGKEGGVRVRPDGMYDPNGTIADQINNCGGSMYFITGVAPPGATRTFDVHEGQAVYVPIVGVADSEGPGINPTIPNFPADQPAAHVNTVLNAYEFSNVSLSVDGKPVTDLYDMYSGIFSAGVVAEGSVAQDFFGAAPGTTLATTGTRGYVAILDDLSKGTHTVKTTGTSTLFGNSATFESTLILKVD